MNYPFRTTYKQDADTYIEDRGHAFTIRRGNADFDTLDAEFGSLLAPGQTAIRENNGDGWEVKAGFPMLEALKQARMEELHRAWLSAEANGQVNSSVGFAIDATERANRDITGLITGLEATNQTTTTFCAADNSFHEVTLDQLKTMLLEIIQHGQAIYAAKWQMRQAIEGATTLEAVSAVNISFAGV